VKYLLICKALLRNGEGIVRLLPDGSEQCDPSQNSLLTAYSFNMLSFNRRYFLIAVILFFILVFIAAFVRDRFIRPYFGDFLVVIFLYYFARSFFNLSPVKITIGVLLVAYLIELLQYFHFVQTIGLGDVEIARIILGNGFEWWDIVAYTLGAITVLAIEYFFAPLPTSKN
jgi:Protein of unknown function (DUF2809)